MPLRTSTPAPPADHYNYDELAGDAVTPKCLCCLCLNWDKALAETKAIEATGESDGHPPYCLCDPCKILRAARIKMTAEGVRRDAYSELSFITRNKAWRKEFLVWFFTGLKTSKRRDSYFAFKFDRITLGEHVERWAIETGRVEA